MLYMQELQTLILPMMKNCFPILGIGPTSLSFVSSVLTLVLVEVPLRFFPIKGIFKTSRIVSALVAKAGDLGSISSVRQQFFVIRKIQFHN